MVNIMKSQFNLLGIKLTETSDDTTYHIVNSHSKIIGYVKKYFNASKINEINKKTKKENKSKNDQYNK